MNLGQKHKASTIWTFFAHFRNSVCQKDAFLLQKLAQKVSGCVTTTPQDFLVRTFFRKLEGKCIATVSC